VSVRVTYPKRLIEEDLPIRRISEHARREKSIRHGHISTLHIWWARRPLAACRAVILAALWPDPGDDGCPEGFRTEARRWLLRWASEFPTKAGAETAPRLLKIRDEPKLLDDPKAVRQGLLDFIADFANWDWSNDKDFLAMSRALVQCAHENLGGTPTTKSLVLDPFAGGGTIPFEALRVGADAIASDLNPVPVLINKVLLEYAPRYGAALSDAVSGWGKAIGKELHELIGEVYPLDPDGAVPQAYIWSRTILSEAPSSDGLPVEVPLIRSMWLSRKTGDRKAFAWVRDSSGRVSTESIEVTYQDGTKRRVRRPLLEIRSPVRDSDVDSGTSRGGAATCPVTGYTTSVENVRTQLLPRRGGTRDARLLGVVIGRKNSVGRHFRLPTAQDVDSTIRADEHLRRILDAEGKGLLSSIPSEAINHIRGFFNVPLYGMTSWETLFTSRQLLALVTISRLIQEGAETFGRGMDPAFMAAVRTCLALALGKQADSNSSLCSWRPTSLDVGHTFGRQALPMFWDFCEVNILSGATRDWGNAVEGVLKALGGCPPGMLQGHADQIDAAKHSLPTDSVNAVVTDPPYYAAVPYADLSDFFYVWLRRTIADIHPDLFEKEGSPKAAECVSLAHRAAAYREKDNKWFERQMTEACREARRITRPDGVGVFVFASKETAAWEAMLGALVDAGWVVSASWPIDTEMGTRLRARNSATLASSIHIVCRPRENPDGSLRMDDVAEWREVLGELPTRIHNWMPRLRDEGIVGADAIFACLGPALEIFSRYSKVEKASGEKVELKEYLEHVWAAVAKEAIATIFAGAETTGFEEDARLTAMWLWTVAGAGASSGPSADSAGDEDDESEDEDVDSPTESSTAKGFSLEYDAARKIAQGLGAHLEALESLVQVKGSKARLLAVGERAAVLFGDADPETAKTGKAKKRKSQLTLGFLEEIESAEVRAGGPGGKLIARPAATFLDRVHQAMILFGAGRGEALRRFLVDDGAGKDERFWRLAQALNQLYPGGTDERRWVEGVMARKKGLGL
jgi:putative DNA methylase